jgi:predicted DNA-binding transcriptional regulator AlpA
MHDNQVNHPAPDSPSSQAALDRFITIEEAARIIAHSKSWIYGRREQLPWVVRTPEGTLRVSVSKLREWMSQSRSG